MRLGFIGTGVMGHSMVKHLLARGDKVTVYNRTFAKSQALEPFGAVAAASIPDLVAKSPDGVLCMVGYPADVDQVLLGAGGVLDSIRSGSNPIVIDLTTSSPTLARTVYERAKEKNIVAVDAPVTGGDVGAREGKLSILVGAESQGVFDRAKPILSAFGTPRLMGGPGMGQQTKLANQVVIAGAMIGVVEGMVFAHKSGISLDAYIEAISGGGAASKSLSLYAPRIMAGDFRPGFFVDHFVKDLGLALDECRRMGLALPGLALVSQLYSSLQGHGEGHLGTQALILAIDRLSKADGPWMAAHDAAAAADNKRARS